MKSVANIHHGDCLEVLRTIASDSIDAIVTDPPYGLSFMGKRWDYDVPSVDVWAECLRVLKPGGHLLAFAGTRTQHRMAVRIEDAGFEIRDMIAWVYGSGFPKSLDVSKAIDKAAGRIGHATESIKDILRRAHQDSGRTLAQLNEVCGFEASGYLRDSSTWANVLPPQYKWPALRDALGLSQDLDSLFAEAEREVVGFQKRGNAVNTDFMSGGNDITAPATDAARQWQGWGTALKPSIEPITVARKPLIGTVAANVLAHGTGGLNVDGCRVGEGEARPLRVLDAKPTVNNTDAGRMGNVSLAGGSKASGETSQGRWPANLIHDGSEEVTSLFPSVKGVIGAKREGGDSTIFNEGGKRQAIKQKIVGGIKDDGSAARFFYCAKASQRDRGQGNAHPTVKPTDLMRYLCRLVTPPNGIVLDPFMGSGSTGKAARMEGFRFIGIEREASYIEIARSRIPDAVSIEQPKQSRPKVVRRVAKP